ncbi:hypothetical protein CPB85DRAFT_1278702 [Mucidula mucida]|nr:hypothetical protein CPB85DRAFT_1278702 [Mucidula mucida]
MTPASRRANVLMLTPWLASASTVNKPILDTKPHKLSTRFDRLRSQVLRADACSESQHPCFQPRVLSGLHSLCSVPAALLDALSSQQSDTTPDGFIHSPPLNHRARGHWNILWFSDASPSQPTRRSLC